VWLTGIKCTAWVGLQGLNADLTSPGQRHSEHEICMICRIRGSNTLLAGPRTFPLLGKGRLGRLEV